jgi:hypothetical protein
MIIFLITLIILVFLVYKLYDSNVWMQKGGDQFISQKSIFEIIDSDKWTTNLKVKYTDLSVELKYIDTKDYFIPNIHVGQRKLFLAAYQFLKLYPGEKYLVYAGSAPNKYGWLLHECFPNMKFIYIDPADHDLIPTNISCKHIDVTRETLDIIDTGPNTIYLIKDFFDSDYAKKFKYLDCIFMCDIRSISGKKLSEGDVCNNLSQQAVWFKLMDAKAASLKFRVPFKLINQPCKLSSPNMKHDLDLASEFGYNITDNVRDKNAFMYFSGEIYLQAYAGKTSAETRLVIDRGAKFIEYNNLEYENKLFYYNIFCRNSLAHLDLHEDSMFHDQSLEQYILGQCNLSDRFTKLMGRYHGEYRAKKYKKGSITDDAKAFYIKFKKSHQVLLKKDSKHNVHTLCNNFNEYPDCDDYIQYVDKRLHRLWLIESFKAMGGVKILVTDIECLQNDIPDCQIIYIGDYNKSSFDETNQSFGLLIEDFDSVFELKFERFNKYIVTSKYPGPNIRGKMVPSPYLDVGYISIVGYKSDRYMRIDDPRMHKSFFNKCYENKLFGKHIMMDYQYSSSSLAVLLKDSKLNLCKGSSNINKLLDSLADEYWFGWLYSSEESDLTESINMFAELYKKESL